MQPTRKLMESIKECHRAPVDIPRVLRLTDSFLCELRKLRPSDWEADKWEKVPEQITSVKSGDDEFLDSLRTFLKKHFGIAAVEKLERLELSSSIL